MNSPQNHIWGPELWMILHSSAERYGSSSSKQLPNEEKRIWTGLLRSLRFSLPCPRCKKHYSEYLLSHPLVFSKEGIRSWLYHLHSDVNRRNEKQTEYTLEQVEEQYSKPFHFAKHELIVHSHMMMALRLGWSTREDIQRTIRFFEELRRYYGWI